MKRRRSRVCHPHIVQVFDFEIAGSGEYVLAMEFLEGGTLKERLVSLAAEGRGLDPRECVRIVAEVAEALEYAHEQGVIHRDVKPSNVMLTRKDWAVVTDFGIARILGATSLEVCLGLRAPVRSSIEGSTDTRTSSRRWSARPSPRWTGHSSARRRNDGAVAAQLLHKAAWLACLTFEMDDFSNKSGADPGALGRDGHTWPSLLIAHDDGRLEAYLAAGKECGRVA